MLTQGARVIVAVSGGADSVCLLHVLRELAPASIAGVAHFNHKWRAEASDEDERFVAALASRLALPFFRGETGPGAAPGNLEQEARRARLAFFAGIRVNAAAASIALGHTRDDQAETVLFRFLRGSGLAGLSGIPPAPDGIIRPLLDVTRAEVEEFLRSRNIPWREDASNLDLRFARNRIRHELLPQLARDWNPHIVDALAKTADLAHEEEAWWTSEIDRIASNESCASDNAGTQPRPQAALDLGSLVLRSQAVELRVAALSALPRALARRLIRRAITLAKGDLRRIDFDHVESILTLQRSLRVPGLIITKSFDWIRFAPHCPPAPREPLQIIPSGTYPCPDRLTEICVEIAQKPPNPCATLKAEACWFQRSLPLVLRGWRPGDRYRPRGQSRDQKIQEMFQKARIPSWQRPSWPILTSADKILWSRQFGVADEFAAAGDGRTALWIREIAVS